MSLKLMKRFYQTVCLKNDILQNFRKSLLASNVEEMILNGQQRKTPIDTTTLRHLIKQFEMGKCDAREEQQLKDILYFTPNHTSSHTPIGDESQARKLFEFKHTSLNELPSPTKAVNELLGPNGLHQLRLHDVTFGAPDRSYYFIGDVALLEAALVQFALDKLLPRFQFVTVPDLIPAWLIEACGFPVRRERTQVYRVSNPPELTKQELCLAGTGEMGLAAYAHSLFGAAATPTPKQWKLPQRFCTVSRCYRREAPSQEPLLYRVHQFTKVEMFALAHPQESDKIFEEILAVQKEIFSQLELSFRVLEMPSEELGLPAFRKVDMEAWMPGESKYGEISSASNCTDYQAMRLGLGLPNEEHGYLHTLNGTAVAVTRTIKALMESHQAEDGSIVLPAVLWPYLNGKTKLQRQHPPVYVTRIHSLKNIGSSV